MKQSPILACVIIGTFLMTACSKEKPADTNPTASTAANPEPSNPNANMPQPAPVQEATPAPPPPPPPPPKPVVIPAGTVLTVRLQSALGSKTSKPGDRFSATLADPIVVDGKTVAGAGSGVSGTVTEAHAAGRFKGGATLNVVADTLSIRGVRYHVKTMAVSQESKGKGKRTAAMVGGGAGGGALIGGLAGGGKGAAIGALVGAGAGTAGAAFTGNRDITLPAETALSFQMTASLTLKTAKAEATETDADQQAPPPQ